MGAVTGSSLPGCYAVSLRKQLPTFRRNFVPSFSGLLHHEDGGTTILTVSRNCLPSDTAFISDLSQSSDIILQLEKT